ncbi:dihydrodipicolinate synthase family protein [Alphaproteobacteria bacterium]|nr:dihydrodipicolinate synthase family protein [Alphaproteobacteria bacterium]
MHKIKGVYSASLTPVNKQFSINKSLLLSHSRWLLDQGVDGLGVFGTTGEANSFSIDEKINALEFLIQNNIRSDQMIPGTGQCSIYDTVRFTKKCSELNVKAVLILPPFFYKNVSDQGVIDYFRRLVEGVADNNLKYILYNIPQNTGVPINFNIIENLIKLYPNNIVGMKDSSGSLDNMLKVTKLFNEFSLFSGSDSLALKVCQRGGAGAITATSNISGKLLSFIVNNYKKESSIANFQEMQFLQVKIRETLFVHEPVSALKALMSVKENNVDWNRINPPLNIITNPENNKIVIKLIKLLKEMDVLLSSV